MPVLIGWLLNGLRLMFATRLGLFITGALGWLSLSFGSKKLLLDPAVSQLESYMNQLSTGDLGSSAVQWAGVLNLDTAVTMVVSAYVMRQGIGAGRMFLKKRGA